MTKNKSFIKYLDNFPASKYEQEVCKTHKIPLKNRKDKKGKFCPECAGYETIQR